MEWKPEVGRVMLRKEKRIRLMGTVIDITIEDKNAEKIIEAVISLLELYENRFSANDEKSELMQVNHQAGKEAVKVHPDLYELIEIGKKHSCAADSHLNIGIGPLVQSWRIGFSDAKVPSNQEISRLLNKTNAKKIILNKQDKSVFLEEEGMFIDLGALAKGFIADLIIVYLKEQQVETALLNLGGNIVALGPGVASQRAHWKIGIQNPLSDAKEHLAVLKIADQSVVTSGIYERNYESDGETYHHILSPQTGYPIESDVASLTIVSDQSVDGEIWTTRLFGKNSEEIIVALEEIEGIEGLVVTKTGKILKTKGLEQFIV